jgi:hypothetical protein
VICVGDSSNLDFVPSGSFDLVYTGYLTWVVVMSKDMSKLLFAEKRVL